MFTSVPWAPCFIITTKLRHALVNSEKASLITLGQRIVLMYSIVLLFCDLNLTRLKNDDEGAAKAGVVETTTEAAVYPHPNNEKIKFWDLPGTGIYQLLTERQLLP